jgi:hypothetical protein
LYRIHHSPSKQRYGPLELFYFNRTQTCTQTVIVSTTWSVFLMER